MYEECKCFTPLEIRLEDYTSVYLWLDISTNHMKEPMPLNLTRLPKLHAMQNAIHNPQK